MKLVLGQGSFGRAVLVQTKNSKDKWVMKEIRLPRRGMRSTRREAVLLSRMKHPNIVAFKDSFEDDDHLYIIMEYCSGGDLLQKIHLQKGTLFSENVILRWFVQMCLGAKHIHDKRVLHRDLKSKNIFLTAHGTVKLGDFGSACTLKSAEGYAHTYVGTPYYVSPEIWDNQPYNNKSDVWSLGCVLYELCTLRHPFQAHSWKSLILRVCRGAYTPLPSHLPYELHYLIKHMFKTNPRDRPSIQTILNSHRVSRLLCRHLPAESKERVEEPVSRWRTEDGEDVAVCLGHMSLITTSTNAGQSLPERESSSVHPRKKWTKGPSSTVLEALGQAEIMSSSATASAGDSDSRSAVKEVCVETQKKRERKQWVKDPPERLLSLLEKAHLSAAFKTYTISTACSGPLPGPLATEPSDVPDGPEEIPTDHSRLDPRSDDEDTDFEEECPLDWVQELERMEKEHQKHPELSRDFIHI
ncbi:serine/threonine-protein kinase Nek3 isoform X2 [Brachyhypopomus gauderio]|uniref:serine/threonine-protein kinase Nek3 isoform X2 n=1 Tax=Brachyhypopomus gauderio TaxID=698409 RepID=UPI0040425AF0